MVNYVSPIKYVYFNPNPKNNHESGDCVIRAISKVMDKDWDTVYTGIVTQGFIEKMMPSLNPVWDKYLQNNGFLKRSLPNCPDCITVKEFAEKFPQGRYVVATGNHAVAVIDGKYYDSFDSGEELLIYYFEEGN